MNPFTDPEVDETAPTMEMPLRPRTGAPAPDQSNTTPTSSNAPQTNPAPTMEMPLRPRPHTSAPAPRQSNTTPTSSTAPQTNELETRIAELEKELAESKRREEALRTHYEARETAAAAFVNDIVDATNEDVAMGDDDDDDDNED